jgi:flagellar hook-associated protein 3 FlgL
MTILSTSTSAFFDRARGEMTTLRARSEKLQAQIGSEARLSRSSDDPVAASRLRNLARADMLSNIDTSNAKHATADLSIADATMSDIARAVIRVQELAGQAASGIVSDAQRATIGKEIASINETLFSLANTRDSSGHALFGGENAAAAYTLDEGNAIYAGTTRTGQLPLGDGQTVAPSMTGPEFLSFQVNGVETDLLATVKALADALQGGAVDGAAAARGSLDALAAGLESVTTGQTVIGTRLAWIDLTSERRTNLGELRADEQKDVGGIDLATSIARLQEMMTVLEASQASFSRLSQLSLFNQL